ncbi:unnamed protein product [Rhodiola kirilowii]
MASDDNHTPPLINNDDDMDDEDTEEEEEDDDDEEGGQLNIVEEDEDDDDEEEEDDLNASFNSHPTTLALPPPPLPANIPSIVEVLPAKKLTHPGDDQARKLFQRLWTDEDEIGLLQGFLEYSTQRGTYQNNPHDTALFYDQIKTKLQLDFNKNQLVEKLRRLKKKYRNVLARISSGKEVSFKTPHDQATFEIATKIWGTTHTSMDQIQHQRRIDDDDMPPNFNPTTTTNLNLNFANINHHSDKVSDDRKSQHKSNKRIRVKMDGAVPTSSSHAQIPIWQPITIEETVKKRISPLFREMYERSGGSRGFGDGIVSPMPLSFGSPVNMFGMEAAVDDKWRKQQILELEVYSRRLELVQEHIKLTLEQLRSMGS